LVTGSQPGDHLFFHFSGHGSQVKDTSGDEEDGFDETLIPVDFRTAGQIIDDELHDRMVKPLKKGVRLTAIFDCCHSGTLLDLPFVYKASGEYTSKPGELDKETTISSNVVKNVEKDSIQLIKIGDTKLKQSLSILHHDEESGKLKPLSIAQIKQIEGEKKKVTNSNYVPEFDELKIQGASEADIISISGCRDDQTSADVKSKGTATGAMSFALLTVLKNTPHPILIELLNRMRDALKEKKFTQVPQMSTGHHINPHSVFEF